MNSSRYTSKKSESGISVYAILLNWPKGGSLTLASATPTPHTTVSMLGYTDVFNWKENPAKGIDIIIPPIPSSQLPCQWAWTLKLENLAWASRIFVDIKWAMIFNLILQEFWDWFALAFAILSILRINVVCCDCFQGPTPVFLSYAYLVAVNIGLHRPMSAPFASRYKYLCRPTVFLNALHPFWSALVGLQTETLHDLN